MKLSVAKASVIKYGISQIKDSITSIRQGSTLKEVSDHFGLIYSTVRSYTHRPLIKKVWDNSKAIYSTVRHYTRYSGIIKVKFIFI